MLKKLISFLNIVVLSQKLTIGESPPKSACFSKLLIIKFIRYFSLHNFTHFTDFNIFFKIYNFFFKIFSQKPRRLFQHLYVFLPFKLIYNCFNLFIFQNILFIDIFLDTIFFPCLELLIRNLINLSAETYLKDVHTPNV